MIGEPLEFVNPNGIVPGYKLLRVRKDGTLGPLFINRRQVIEPRVWYQAEEHPTPGFAFRPGWHVMSDQYAPHLKMTLANGERREWWRVAISDFTIERRPLSQGGTWFLARHMMVVSRCPR